MGYNYDISTSKKDKTSTMALAICHLFYSAINIFLSTFLIAYIYSLTSDLYSYVAKVGLFQMFTYIVMLIAYYFISIWVDKSNRVWPYRLSFIVELVIILFAIFFGEYIADYIILIGLLNGLAMAMYYASYNVLKQEMVSRNSIKKFYVISTILGKLIGIFCPVIFGALIDVSTYSIVACFVLILSVVQLVVSFFINSKRPDNSKLDLKGYLKKLKIKNEFNSKIKFLYLICFAFGFTSIVANLLNISIIQQFGTNFSIGALAGVFSVITIVFLIFVNKFTKEGKRTWLMLVGTVLPIFGSVLFIAMPNIWTLIIFDFSVSITETMFSLVLDVNRNKNLKEAGMYENIAEHQTMVESLFCLSRIISFGSLIIVAWLKNYLVYQIAYILFVLSYSVLMLLLLVYENKYSTKNE